MLSQRQLQAELTDKRTLVTNLKQQLDMHQSNVDDLKTELNRARKRQVAMDTIVYNRQCLVIHISVVWNLAPYFTTNMIYFHIIWL